MKRLNSLFSPFLERSVAMLLLATSLFSTSCGEQIELLHPGDADGEIVDVSKELRISVLPLCSAGISATRVQDEQPEKGQAVHASYGEAELFDGHVATRVQDVTEDKTEDESKINNAYILQFGGTSSTAVLKKKISVTADQLKGGSSITCTFSMTSGVKNRVYVVANCSKTLTEGTTTLGGFEAAVTLAPTGVVPTGGLPMSACQDVGVGDVFDVFQLKSVLAKLIFTCKTAGATLKLKGLPVGYSFYTQTEPGDFPFRPVGMTYNNNGVTLTSGSTYYVPENLSGRNELLIKHVTRALGLAPANAMYVEITNSGTVYNLLLGDGSPQDFNFAGNYAYNIGVTLYGTDAYDLRVGNPIPPGTVVTDLTVSGETANCYLVPVANAWYMFNNTVMGNGAVTPVPVDLNANSIASAIIPTRLNPASGDVLWETLNTTTAPSQGDIVNKNIYLLKDRFLFKSGTAEGNAVIAARDASNAIVWSWHIWRTNSEPLSVSLAEITDGEGFSVTGLEMMDRNLGALSAGAQDNLSAGLHYQWGRKDPMVGVAGLTAPNNVVMATQPSGIPVIPGSTAQYTVAQSIARPTTFLRYGGDWCTTRNDNLWGTALTVISGKYTANKGSKTIYDPCPVGWRVPSGYTFKNTSISNGGIFNFGYSFCILTSGSSWFPASGSRRYNDGMLYNAGVGGYCWTSAPNANYPANGSGLNFVNGSVNSAGYNSRADGNSCRCVKESFVVVDNAPVDLSPSGTANCYVVTKSGRYSFDATVMGNGKTTPANGAANSADITPTVLSPASAEVLWESLNTTTAPAKGDIVSDIKLMNGKVIFTAGTKQGNAVIAVKDASGTIIWSWHIWRTATDPTTSNTIPLAAISGFASAGELVMMDRNLGALSATPQDNLSTGLHYQWGRKDPMPAYAGLTSPNNVVMVTQPSGVPVIPNSEAQYTVEQSIAQPTTFLRNAGDWCSIRNDNFWGTPLTTISGDYTTNKGCKTIYDPCPVGWRIPPGYVFKNASTSNGDTFNLGYSFSILTSGSSWFPASGGRSSSYGSLYGIGTHAYYWTSTPFVGTSMGSNYLLFNSIEVNPSSSNFRPYGSSCRCVKE